MSLDHASGRAEGPQTVLVGLGATKAGTSWLNRYLRAHPDCASHGPKELHFFDARAAGKLPAMVRKHEGKVAQLTKQMARAREAGRPTERQAREIEAQSRWIEALKGGEDADWSAYLRWSAQGRRVAFDITPAYGTLEEEALVHIASLHPRVRFVYLMRDPVARLWSHARMRAMRAGRAREVDAATHEAEARAVMREAIAGELPALTDRGDYAATLSRLGALDPATVHVAFYEELFTDAGVAAICDLVGIEARPGDYDHRVHGGLKVSLDAETRARARDHLAPQYEAARAWAGRLPAGWEQTEAA